MVSEISITAAVAANPDANSPALVLAATRTTNATFKIDRAKIHVPVVTLSINGNIKFLEHLKQLMNQVILNLCPETQKLSVINRTLILVPETKSSTAQKY